MEKSTLTIAANNLGTEMTNHNVGQDDLRGEHAKTNDHVQNNMSVRDMLGQRGIKPEQLPPEGGIKKLEHRVRSEKKKRSRPKVEIVRIANTTFRNFRAFRG